MTLNKQVFKDIERVRRKFDLLVKDIKIDAENKVQEVGNLGFNYAFNIAPHLTGALKASMRLDFPTLNSAVIISGHPSGDIMPIHILWDTGEYPNIFPNYKIKKPEGMFFMQKTFMLLQQEFPERLGIAIHHSIEKIGGRR